MQDDPSFLPGFALPPPDLLTDLDFVSIHDPSRSGESQSLTPFGSQQSSQSSNVGNYGLVLPSSSPERSAGINLGGDDGSQNHNDFLDIDKLLNLEEPEFIFGEDGDIIEFSPGPHAPKTPVAATATGGTPMLSDAGASARVRQEHEEGQLGGMLVSSAAISHPTRTSSLLARPTPMLPPTHHIALHARTLSLT